MAKKRRVKKIPPKRVYKSATVQIKKFHQPRRARGYAVKRASYTLKRKITVNAKTRKNLSKNFSNKIKRASKNFYSKHSKGSKHIFHARVGFSIVKGRKKIQSGFALRTRRTPRRADFDQYIDELIEGMIKAMEGYVRGVTQINIEGFQIQVEGNYGKSKKQKFTSVRSKHGKKKSSHKRVRH